MEMGSGVKARIAAPETKLCPPKHDQGPQRTPGRVGSSISLFNIAADRIGSGEAINGTSPARAQTRVTPVFALARYTKIKIDAGTTATGCLEENRRSGAYNNHYVLHAHTRRSPLSLTPCGVYHIMKVYSTAILCIEED